MTITKVALLFLYSSMKKSWEGFGWFFDVEKWLRKSEFCCFRPSILNQLKDQKYSYGLFCSPLSLNSAACIKITLGTLTVTINEEKEILGQYHLTFF